MPLSNFWSGILFALIVGAVITPTFQQLVDRYARLAPQAGDNRIPPSLTGHLERFFFTIVVAFDVSGAVPGMMTWIVAKMAANWNSQEARAAAESRPAPKPEIS